MHPTSLAVSSRSPRADDEPTKSVTSRSRPSWRWWGWLLAALLVILAVRTYGVEPVRIPSSSMAGTLRPGDHVLVDKASPHLRPWHRGEVVLFQAPPDGELTMKRLVGLPGDTVAIRDGVLRVNGEPVREPYVRPGAIDSVYYGPTQVPAAHVFVLGDNRANSLDSRQYGAVSITRLSGRASWIVWPLRHWGEVS